MKNVVDFLTGNLILNTAIIAWAMAQLIKLFVTRVVEGRWDWKHILSSGGMPSSHSAAVCATAASVGYLYGLSTPLFAVAAVMAVVVMYDAANVRRETGKQAIILNYMMEHWDEGKPVEFEKALKELIGHTPLQVLMGALLGIAVGWGGVWLVTVR